MFEYTQLYDNVEKYWTFDCSATDGVSLYPTGFNFHVNCALSVFESGHDTIRGGEEEKRGKRIRIERDRSIEVHAMVPVTRIPRRGTSPMVSATSNREGWFTSVFPRRLDLPLAKPTTAESKPIRADHAWTDQSSSLFLSFVTFLLPRVALSSGPTLSQDISVILFFSFFLLLHPSTSPIFLYISSVR